MGLFLCVCAVNIGGDIILNFSFSTIVLCLVKLVATIISGVMGYKFGLNNMRSEIDLLYMKVLESDACIEWCKRNPVPAQPVGNSEQLTQGGIMLFKGTVEWLPYFFSRWSFPPWNLFTISTIETLANVFRACYNIYRTYISLLSFPPYKPSDIFVRGLVFVFGWKNFAQSVKKVAEGGWQIAFIGYNGYKKIYQNVWFQLTDSLELSKIVLQIVWRQWDESTLSCRDNSAMVYQSRLHGRRQRRRNDDTSEVAETSVLCTGVLFCNEREGVVWW